jgi:hypothetical protein
MKRRFLQQAAIDMIALILVLCGCLWFAIFTISAGACVMRWAGVP